VWVQALGISTGWGSTSNKPCRERADDYRGLPVLGGHAWEGPTAWVARTRHPGGSTPRCLPADRPGRVTDTRRSGWDPEPMQGCSSRRAVRSAAGGQGVQHRRGANLGGASFSARREYARQRVLRTDAQEQEGRSENACGSLQAPAARRPALPARALQLYILTSAT